MFKKNKKEKSPLDVWEDETMEEKATEGAEIKKKQFSLKKKTGEKKEKKEKVPLTKEQKKKRRRRIVVGAVVFVILAVFVLPKLFGPEALPVVTVSEASVGEVEQIIEGSGTVKSEEAKTYFSPVSATVDDFELKVGDTVEAGEILLTYDGAELDQLYKQAELTGSAANYGYQDAITKNNENVSEYNRSSAALNTIEQQLDEQEDENEHVQNRITEYTGKQADVQLTISQYQAAASDAQSKIDQANLDKKNAQETIQTITQKLDANTAGTLTTPLTPAEIADLEAKKAAAEAVKTNAEQVITAQTAARDVALNQIGEKQKELQTINEKLDGYQERLKKSSEKLTELQSDKAKEQGIKDSSDAAILSSAAKNELKANNNLSTLNAQMTKDDINAGKAGIKAEFSGVVTEVGAVSGGPAAKGGSLFTVASTEDVIVDMSVTRYDLEKLEVGQSAEITLAGHTYTGTVRRLSRLAAANEKGTPVVSAQVHIDNPDENIYLGLEAKVKISGHKAENVIAVPVEAVNTGKEGSFCYVVENGMVVRKDVETGLSSASLIEIKSGLITSDKVILNTTGTVEEGMKVTAVEE